MTDENNWESPQMEWTLSGLLKVVSLRRLKLLFVATVPGGGHGIVNGDETLLRRKVGKEFALDQRFEHYFAAGGKEKLNEAQFAQFGGHFQQHFDAFAVQVANTTTVKDYRVNLFGEHPLNNIGHLAKVVV